MDGFSEVERAFTEEEAVAEARRCLRCGPCGECRSCAPSCTRRHVIVRAESTSQPLGEDSIPYDPKTCKFEDLLLRVPGSIAAALPSERTASAEIDGTRASVIALRCHVDDELCRGCSRCIDACSFNALWLVDDKIRLDVAQCRGCGLCEAVCPTGALHWSGGLSARQIEDDVRRGESPPNADLVLACQRRTGSLAGANVVRLRCVGQIDAGLLLELQRDPNRRIRIAGCASDRCRFGCGASHAAEQIDHARTIASMLKLDPDNLVADWSPDRLHDPLDGGH
jgi:ferredoxin